MTAEPTEPFLAALRESNLLGPNQLAELAAWAAGANPEGPQAVANELVRRGWMTPYQTREVYRGRGKDLTVGPYLLLDLIGEGGMGRVYKARHTRLGREEALKVIRKEKIAHPVVVQRFAQEVRAAAQLAHPNVVQAFDADEAGGVHFLSMEFVEGADLTKIVRSQGPLPVPVGCDYIRQAALGLQHAFEKKLVHRDVKPSNLLVTPRGQVKVLDLGLAMLNAAPGVENANRVTLEGLVLGTPDFLAPEQAQNPQAVDIRADVYALGATLFYILTGRVPFEGATPTDKLVKHVTAPPPSLCEVRPDAPPQLDLVIRWMMAKRPEDRPQTPAQVAQALTPFCPPPPLGSGTVGYPSPAPAYPAPAPVYPAAPPLPVFVPPIAPVPAELAAMAPPVRTDRAARPKPAGTVWVWVGVAVAALVLGLCVVIGLGGFAGSKLIDTLGGPPAEAPVEEFTNAVGMRLVPVRGGPFVMGSHPGEPGRGEDEGPAGEVTLSGPFFVSATEVTHGQFLTVVGTSPAVWPPKMRKSANVPEDNVTWAEAVEFCRKLSEKERNRRPGWVYRLPTEAEWEYACRAGTTTAFPYGEKLVLGRHAFFNLDREPAERGGLGDEEPGRTVERLPHPVGSAEPNAFGLVDTAGNVWEWCGDYYEKDAYQRRLAKDPVGPDAGDWRVLRGGSWKEPASRCRSASRRGEGPTARRDDVGFRVVYAPERR